MNLQQGCQCCVGVQSDYVCNRQTDRQITRQTLHQSINQPVISMKHSTM